MIIVLRPEANEEDIKHIADKIKEWGLHSHISQGEERTIIGIIGDERKISDKPLEIFHGVEKVIPVLKPYKAVSREFHPSGTKIKVGAAEIGGNNIAVLAGPCSVESKEQVIEIAKIVKGAGAKILRGGAFKPRTSPYAFQGMGKEGLEILAAAKKETGLPIVTEVMDIRNLDLICEYTDIIQIGARNMQHFNLLKEVGKTRKPVLLKRGMSATLKEVFMSAEYIASGGNLNIIICERGIRTFNDYFRNTPDISAIPVIKRETHLPVVFDPSHSLGRWDYVDPLAKAAIAAGADGLIIEVHNCPEEALCDGPQSLKPEKFKKLMGDLKKVAESVGRTI